MTLTGSVERLRNAGYSNREIARRLGLWEGAVRKRLRRAGWTDPAPEQKRLSLEEAAASPPTLVTPMAETGCVPNLSAFGVKDDASISFDHDPTYGGQGSGGRKA